MTDEELVRRLRLLNEVDAFAAADRIEALVAKLAKALETLDFISDDFEASLEKVTLMARATAAELKGRK